MLRFMSVNHYENFPVASWLMPAHLRPAIRAIYAFARTADDFADEGDHSDAERHALLEAYQQDLDRIAAGLIPLHPVLQKLAKVIHSYELQIQPFSDLLSAFQQDIQIKSYETKEAVRDYCRRSANPVGRILLRLWKKDQSAALIQASDAICTALQQINFLQDIAIDAEKGRTYLSNQTMQDFQVQRTDLLGLRLNTAPAPSRAVRSLILAECIQCRSLMMSGAHLPAQLRGRIAWELSLVVAGGLRILDKIEAADGDIVFQRPTLSRLDYFRLMWRAWVVGFKYP
jgi:squalene synthase HpnC